MPKPAPAEAPKQLDAAAILEMAEQACTHAANVRDRLTFTNFERVGVAIETQAQMIRLLSEAVANLMPTNPPPPAAAAVGDNVVQFPGGAA